MFCWSHSTELKGLLAAELDLVLQTSDSAYDKVNIPGPGTQCWFAFIFFSKVCGGFGGIIQETLSA